MLSLPELVFDAGSELIAPVVEVVENSWSRSVEFSGEELGVVPTLPPCFLLQLFRQFSNMFLFLTTAGCWLCGSLSLISHIQYLLSLVYLLGAWYMYM